MSEAAPADPRQKIRTRMRALSPRDLDLAFATWLLREPNLVSELQPVVKAAAAREGADQDFENTALLGFAAGSGILAEQQLLVLGKGLRRLAGRSPMVNGSRMTFCGDAVGLMGVVVGTKAIADKQVAAQIEGWASRFFKDSHANAGNEEWQQCLIAAAGRTLSKSLALELPHTPATADVRLALAAHGLIPLREDSAIRDIEETLKMAEQPLPEEFSYDRAALRLTAIEWITRGPRRSTKQDVRPRGSMDLAAQTDPIWEVTPPHKGPVQLTKVNGDVVWINPDAPEEKVEDIYLPDDERLVAEFTIKCQSELRHEIEVLFSGPSWPQASVLLDPLRRYAISIFDVNAAAYQRIAANHNTSPAEALSRMVRALLEEVFGAEWEYSPGETVLRTDWQCGSKGWTGREGFYVAGNDADRNCVYHKIVGDAVTYRYRFHAPISPAAPGEPLGINVSNLEWWEYIGLKERHNLAMAIKPYLEARVEHWLVHYARPTPTQSDIASGTDQIDRQVPNPRSAASKANRDAVTTDKGNMAILRAGNGQLKMAVTVQTASKFGGVTIRSIERAITRGTLKAAGSTGNRRIKVASLLECFPPEDSAT